MWDHFQNGLYINWDAGRRRFLIIKMGDLEGGGTVIQRVVARDAESVG